MRSPSYFLCVAENLGSGIEGLSSIIELLFNFDEP